MKATNDKKNRRRGSTTLEAVFALMLVLGIFPLVGDLMRIGYDWIGIHLAVNYALRDDAIGQKGKDQIMADIRQKGIALGLCNDPCLGRELDVKIKTVKKLNDAKGDSQNLNSLVQEVTVTRTIKYLEATRKLWSIRGDPPTIRLGAHAYTEGTPAIYHQGAGG